MADTDHAGLVAELNKLKKHDLINLIIYKKLPDNFSSDIIDRFMGISADDDCSSGASNVILCDAEEATNGPPDSECVGKVCLQNRLLVNFQRKELDYNQQIIQHVNKRIADLEKIIKLMENSKENEFVGLLPPSVETIPKKRDDGEKSNSTKTYSAIAQKRRTFKTADIDVNTDTHSKTADRVDRNVNTARVSGASVGLGMASKSDKVHVRNRLKDIIYGAKGASNPGDLKGVPRLGFIHVSKLDPATTPDAVETYLKQIVPGCRCEQLDSKHPDVYSSFKITVPYDNITQVMNPSIWPTGARLDRFFHGRRGPRGGT